MSKGGGDEQEVVAGSVLPAGHSKRVRTALRDVAARVEAGAL